MPNAPVTFENVFDFWEAREYSYKQKNWQKVSLLAEGIINGKVVCSEKKMPSRRSTKVRLTVDALGKKLVADGSDFVVVVAEITDDNGNVRRLAKENVVFTVEGEGEIIGDQSIGANPRAVEWGSAPVLIRSTTKAGKIKLKAHVQFEGTQAPTAAELELESVPADVPFNYLEQKVGKELNPKVGKQISNNSVTKKSKNSSTR
jgi:beta-galactosidase